MKRDYDSLFKTFAEQWFLAEPLLFSVLCTHEIKANPEMLCPMRTGGRLIEYRPASLDNIEESDIREMLRTEVIRIMLMHPYQRLPLHPDRVAMIIASDITISENGHFAYGMYSRKNWVCSEGEERLPVKGYFEEYYVLVKEHMMGLSPDGQITDDETIEESGEGKTTPADSNIGGKGRPQGRRDSSPKICKEGASDLWEPDDVMRERIYRAIDTALAERFHGTVSDDLIEEIRSDRTIRINCRRHLAMFHASVISTRRVLSRMRPSRRYGFTQPGVRHPYCTRLLIGIDTSESVLSRELGEFLSIINRFFHSGIDNIDVLFFDCEIHLPVVNLRRARNSIKVVGRGGTDFQPIINFFDDSDYDGLIVFTDGDAPLPDIKNSLRILWILTDREAYERSQLSPKIYIPH